MSEPIRVLVVEDAPVAASVVEKLLLARGCLVDIANTGLEALNKAKEGCDLILMDIGLPDSDGISVSKAIRNELNIDTPIIAITAHEWDADAYSAAGMNGSLRKPVTDESLARVLERCA